MTAVQCAASVQTAVRQRHLSVLTADFCQDCARNPERTVAKVVSRLHAQEQRQLALHRICSSCAQLPATQMPPCVSFECPNLYSRIKTDAQESEERTLLTRTASQMSKSSEDAWSW